MQIFPISSPNNIIWHSCCIMASSVATGADFPLFSSSASCYYNRTHVVVVISVGTCCVHTDFITNAAAAAATVTVGTFTTGSMTSLLPGCYWCSRASIRSSHSSRSRKRRRHWDGVCWLQFVVPATMVYVRWMTRYLSIIIIIRKKRYIPYYGWCHAQYCNDNSMQ